MPKGEDPKVYSDYLAVYHSYSYLIGHGSNDRCITSIDSRVKGLETELRGGPFFFRWFFGKKNQTNSYFIFFF